MFTRPLSPTSPDNLPPSVRPTSVRSIASRRTQQDDGAAPPTTDPVRALPQVVTQRSHHHGTMPGPVLRSQSYESGIGRTQYELTCDLDPPAFPVEELLHIGMRAYQRKYGLKPGYLYVHWQQIMELVRATGTSYFEDIPVHARSGVGFWCVVATRYALPPEEGRT